MTTTEITPEFAAEARESIRILLRAWNAATPEQRANFSQEIDALGGRYMVKCDDCRQDMRRCKTVQESAAGGRCESCGAAIDRGAMEAAGRNAHARGGRRVPALDPAYLARIAGRAVGECQDLSIAWLRGYDQSNLVGVT